MREAIRTLALPAPDRTDVVDHFLTLGLDRRVGLWMTTNLRREADGFYWRFQPSVVASLLDDYGRIDGWPMIDGLRRVVPVHVVLAGRSVWWRGAPESRLRALDGVEVHHLVDAGHWVHVDDPDGLVGLFSRISVPS